MSVLQDLANHQLISCACTADHFMNLRRDSPFRAKMVRGDGKWKIYHNVTHVRPRSRRSSAFPTKAKTGLHPKKVVPCVSWDCRKAPFDELLSNKQSATSVMDCKLFDCLKYSV